MMKEEKTTKEAVQKELEASKIILKYLLDQKVQADDQYEARLVNQEYIPSNAISNIISYLDGEIKVQQQNIAVFEKVLKDFEAQEKQHQA